MSDWDFLHDMHDQGYSPEEIADAAGSGAAPWEWEYISREWIDSQLGGATADGARRIELNRPDLRGVGFASSTSEQTEVFYDLVDCAARYFESTGRYLQIWGELGEIYAEIKFGLCRHDAHTAGSDGTISGKLVEVKTISPEKTNDQVFVKSQGDFEQLLVIRIDQDFQFVGKLVERSELKGSNGKFLRSRFKNDANKG